MTASEDLRKLYLKCRTQGIKVDPSVAAVAIRAVGDYGTIRGAYHDSIFDAIASYLDGRSGLSAGSSAMKRACATAFVDAFETGWVDTQGEGATYDPAPEDSQWLADKIQQEFSNIDVLFQTMKSMVSDTEEPITQDEITQYATDRATGYSATLDAVYGQGKLRSQKNKMLTLDGPDGQESCRTCQKYKGQRHRASWWISRDLIPAPGNENYECGGWQCQHVLSDDSGNQWTGQV
jgi:hypothetical protein